MGARAQNGAGATNLHARDLSLRALLSFPVHTVIPIGIFDSGYGGLTVFRAIRDVLPEYDYLYLGDNARAPYGNRSQGAIYRNTWQCVRWFFAQGCPLVILACNTASAKALRRIQQQDLPQWAPERRVLGVIRPTAEVIGNYSITGHIGIVGTRGTIQSGAYQTEVGHFFPNICVHGQACPMWVPLIEYGEQNTLGAEFFVKKYLNLLLEKAPLLDTLLLACTHYPLIQPLIQQNLPHGIRIVSQGVIVAASLRDYLHRHASMNRKLTRGRGARFFTTDDPLDFDAHAAGFFGEPVASVRLSLEDE